MWTLYNLLFPLAFLFMLPGFIFRMLRRGGYRKDFAQRLGFFSHETKQRIQMRRRVWIHAVSVGEIYLALDFMKAVRKEHPDVAFAVSTTTSTAHALAQKKLDTRDVIFYFPIDLPGIMSKVLRILAPGEIILVEGEIWPNLIRIAHTRNIPVALINGRLSDSSFYGYRFLRPLTKDILRRVNPICVQGEQDAARMREMGAPAEQVHAVGSMKFDGEEVPERADWVDRLLQQIGLPEKANVLLGASTWAGEEEILADLFKHLREKHAPLFLILAPRHAERAEEVVQTLKKLDLNVVRRSTCREGAPANTADVLLLDTTGELKLFYAVADVVFVGKSLTRHGGQNPIEPAAHGKAMVTGPHMENFSEAMKTLHAYHGIEQVDDAVQLKAKIEELLAKPERRMQLAMQAAKAIESGRGGMQRTLRLLNRFSVGRE